MLRSILTRFIQFFIPHRGVSVPDLVVIEWEVMPYSFRTDWFVDGEGGFLKSPFTVYRGRFPE